MLKPRRNNYRTVSAFCDGNLGNVYELGSLSFIVLKSSNYLLSVEFFLPSYVKTQNIGGRFERSVIDDVINLVGVLGNVLII